MQSTLERQPGRGQRWLAAWFAVVALAVLLLGAGVVIFDQRAPAAGAPIVAAGPPPLPAPTAGAGEPQVSTSPAAAAARTSVALPAATLTAECRLVICGEQRIWRDRFVGTCMVADIDGATLAALQGTTDGRALSFTLPASVQRVRFVAAGFTPVERELPPVHDGVVGFGTIVLEPDAAVRVSVRNVPVGWQGRTDCHAFADPAWQRAATLAAPELATGIVLRVPSGRGVHLRVQTEGGIGLQFCASLPPLTLRAGETRDCEVDVSALSTTTLRVIGPSPDLLAQMAVKWCRAGPPAQYGHVQLDARGMAELRGSDVAQLAFAADAVIDQCPLRPSPAAASGELELQPETRLVGLRLRSDDGTLVPFAISLGEGTSDVRLLHVFTATKVAAAETITAEIDRKRQLRWPATAIAWQGTNADVGELDARAATRRTSLTVVPTGPPPDQAHHFRLQIRAPDGTTQVLHCRGNAFRSVGLAPGRYALRWQISDEAGPVIDDALALTAGDEHELSVAWPAFTMWTGEVSNWRAIPAPERLQWVRFGRWTGFADGAQLKVDDDGHFVVPLPATSTGPGTYVELRQGTQGFVARVVAVDARAHHVVVEHPRVRWIDLRVQPHWGHGWTLLLYAPDQSAPWKVLHETSSLHVPLPLGGLLHGSLDESDPMTAALQHTTAFATLDGSSREVTIAATGGHWCSIRLAREAMRLRGFLLDPRGNPCGYEVHAEAPGAARLWVPDGATGIRLVLEPGGDQTFDAAREEIVIR